MNSQIVSQRLRNQKLTGPGIKKPADIVSWLGAVQAQEFAVAKWALGLRSPGLTEADVDRAFDDGTIVRTHILRPTWHFVAPEDIRWMQKLTGPRVQRQSASYHRNVGLDQRAFARSRRVLKSSLRDGRHLTRAALGAALTRAGIPVDGLRLAFLMMQAELDLVICSGPRQGKQFTYALLDERVPDANRLDGEEALGELVRRVLSESRAGDRARLRLVVGADGGADQGWPGGARPRGRVARAERGDILVTAVRKAVGRRRWPDRAPAADLR